MMTDSSRSLVASFAEVVDMLREINRWYAYARWANTLMLDACETLPVYALTRETGSNHATYHRGQVMQSVRQLGGSVRSSDYPYWLPHA